MILISLEGERCMCLGRLLTGNYGDMENGEGKICYECSSIYVLPFIYVFFIMKLENENRGVRDEEVEKRNY